MNITPERCLVGFDAYKNLLATDVDLVILACPPHFRPRHLAAAVEAGKHIFMEKRNVCPPAYLFLFTKHLSKEHLSKFMKIPLVHSR